MPQLITLEGLDGSGKTSTIAELRKLYNDRDDIVFTRQPTHDTLYGNYVYASIKDETADPLSELFLYMADHANHLNTVIRPALENGKHVVCDRYLDSRIAYQSATLDGVLPNAYEYIRDIHLGANPSEITDPWTRIPDTTFYLDVSPSVAAERSGRTNKFEATEHLENVQTHYAQLQVEFPDRFVTVDAEREENAVKSDLIGRISELLDE